MAGPPNKVTQAQLDADKKSAEAAKNTEKQATARKKAEEQKQSKATQAIMSGINKVKEQQVSTSDHMKKFGGPLAKLGATGGAGSLKYPSKLMEEEAFWIEFIAMERKFQTRGTQQPTVKRLNSLRLPMVGEIATNYTQNYENVESLLANRAAQSGGGITSEMVLETMAQGAVAGVMKGAGASATAAASLLAGVSKNPHMAVLFKGTEFRSHSFTYKLTALSIEDARAIRQIVSVFKYHASPIMGSLAYTFPDEWEIKFGSSIGIPQLFNIGKSILKSVGVKYGTEGAPTFSRQNNPYPLTVELSLEFQETELVSKDEIAAGF